MVAYSRKLVWASVGVWVVPECSHGCEALVGASGADCGSWWSVLGVGAECGCVVAVHSPLLPHALETDYKDTHYEDTHLPTRVLLVLIFLYNLQYVLRIIAQWCVCVQLGGLRWLVIFYFSYNCVVVV